MPAPESQRPQRPSLLSPTALKLAALAFAAGLLLFLLVWFNSSHDYDFYKADGTPAVPGQAADALPAPLPPDVASSASGLRVAEQPAASDAGTAPAEDQPRIIEAPTRPAPPPPMPPAATANADHAIPRPLDTPAPRYPQEALRRGISGTVRVRVVVAADGSVDRLELAQASGNRYLDRAALEAVRRWRFQPATRNGQPVAAEVTVPIDFNLGGR